MNPILTTLCLAFAAMFVLHVGSSAPADAQHRDQPSERSSMSKPQKIATFLWFDDDAEEAVRLYTSLFKDARVTGETRWGEGGPVAKGKVMTLSFELEGQSFMALNGGPMFRFNEAVSLFVHCDSQAEIDELWTKLIADGGQASQCGWLKDRFGLSWQIVPRELSAMLSDKDPEKARRATAAMLQMQKLDIARLKAAFEGR